MSEHDQPHRKPINKATMDEPQEEFIEMDSSHHATEANYEGELAPVLDKIFWDERLEEEDA